MFNGRARIPTAARPIALALLGLPIFATCATAAASPAASPADLGATVAEVTEHAATPVAQVSTAVDSSLQTTGTVTDQVVRAARDPVATVDDVTRAVAAPPIDVPVAPSASRRIVESLDVSSRVTPDRPATGDGMATGAPRTREIAPPSRIERSTTPRHEAPSDHEARRDQASTRAVLHERESILDASVLGASARPTLDGSPAASPAGPSRERDSVPGIPGPPTHGASAGSAANASFAPPVVALLVLTAFAVPILLRTLKEASASLRPAPFVALLERPG